MNKCSRILTIQNAARNPEYITRDMYLIDYWNKERFPDRCWNLEKSNSKIRQTFMTSTSNCRVQQATELFLKENIWHHLWLHYIVLMVLFSLLTMILMLLFLQVTVLAKNIYGKRQSTCDCLVLAFFFVYQNFISQSVLPLKRSGVLFQLYFIVNNLSITWLYVEDAASWYAR